MRTSRVLVALAALVLPLSSAAAVSSAPSPAPASPAAAGATVTVANMAFNAASVKVGLGESVTWTFQDFTAHTATSDNGFFNTGSASGGASRSVRFPSAGSFAYHCTFHSMMRGRVTVPMAASGSPKDGWKLRWLAGVNPKGRSYDVQVRRVGTTTGQKFRTGTTTGSGRFDPGSGKWQARARTVKGSVARSGWSPALTLPVS